MHACNACLHTRACVFVRLVAEQHGYMGNKTSRETRALFQKKEIKGPLQATECSWIPLEERASEGRSPNSMYAPTKISA